MILRITGFTQEELANYVGVSRASINSWLTNDQSMSDKSKKDICSAFQIPYSFFDIICRLFEFWGEIILRRQIHIYFSLIFLKLFTHSLSS
jgi:transcriptional regulator with XRE-family HTH domain